MLKRYSFFFIATFLWTQSLSCQNVGINTINPDAPLHVGSSGQVATPGGLAILGHPSEGHMELDFFRIQSKYGANPLGLILQDEGGAVGIGMQAATNGPKLQIEHDEWHIEMQNSDDQSVNDWFMGSSDATWSAGDDKFVISPTNLSANANIQLHADGDILLVPQELGAVGIGVSSIGFLPEGFLLAVDGKAIFEEARVQLSGDWPDYVFREDYQLRSLEVLEEDIANLGHLPGMPPACKVENEGVDLGEMQRRMLEKIEELTLYMIAADKEIEALKSANARLDARINSLNK